MVKGVTSGSLGGIMRILTCVASKLVYHLVANTTQIALLPAAKLLYHQVVAVDQLVHLVSHISNCVPDGIEE